MSVRKSQIHLQFFSKITRQGDLKKEIDLEDMMQEVEYETFVWWKYVEDLYFYCEHGDEKIIPSLET